MSVEKIGTYNVRPLNDGRYSVIVNNGNYGARICTAEEVSQLRKNAVNNSSKNVQLGWRDLVNPYETQISASDRITEKFGKSFVNLYKLRNVEGLSGLKLMEARIHNLVAAYYNPFAAVENFKNMFHGKV